ncbi:cobalt/nickel transport system permease protein [Anaerosolibacter carboniphilus]|uniref:Cobalt/nickel transport system permease protein n=1 Tax=Anaerosolibacter carboniphilus TaxID=1417629 RepID=A0A841KW98_9FIRM|nr:cobalt ECF transporter T component CbiQ [Anaerosolibacter carboniphilus]MBB6216290.1 cobalt/nickel transport system permease protein [Anaerosolibacter carboniphilus]
MISIDQYAYINSLRRVHPLEKFILSVATLFVCLFSASWLLHVSVIAFMSFLIVGFGHIPLKNYARYLSLPLLFLIVGILGVIFTITREPLNFLYHIQLGSWMIGMTKAGLDQGRILFLRSYASVICLYFLALTTPMTDIIWVLKKLRVPAIITELMIMIYRFIFVLLETASMMYISQECRLGYGSLRNSYNSLGQLAANLFIKAFHRSQETFRALAARGYTGDISVLEDEYYGSKRNILAIVGIEIIFIALNLVG